MLLSIRTPSDFLFLLLILLLFLHQRLQNPKHRRKQDARHRPDHPGAVPVIPGKADKKIDRCGHAPVSPLKNAQHPVRRLFLRSIVAFLQKLVKASLDAAAAHKEPYRAGHDNQQNAHRQGTCQRAKLQENTAETLNFTLTSPTVLVGMFIGAMLTFVFSAFTMSAVQKAAQSIVKEVRRQFKEIPGIMEYKADPDYASCVSLCTKGALHEMVVPALLAIIVPLATGLVLGPTGVVGLLGGVSVTGFAMAVFMSNAGGAWDNAKKYIEGGHHGGKGSECHKAAVVGDTVGDPFKDTSGPSLNILIKLCSTVSIVFSGLVVAFNLMSML